MKASVITVFCESIKCYRKNFIVLLLFSSLFTVAVGFATFYIRDALLYGWGDTDIPYKEVMREAGFNTRTALFILSLFAALGAGLFSVAVTGGMSKAGDSLTVSAGGALQALRKNFLHVILANMLIFTFVVLGLLLLIIPGIRLMVRYAVAIPAMVAEDLTPRAALKRSKALVRGRGWTVFFIMVLTVIASLIMWYILRNAAMRLILDTPLTTHTFRERLLYAVSIMPTAIVGTILSQTPFVIMYRILAKETPPVPDSQLDHRSLG